MRDKIISDLFSSEEFNACISKMRPVTLQDDLRSEVALILCELPAEKLQALHDQGSLRFYTVRTILNLTHSNTSPFYKKFRGAWLEELGEVPDVPVEAYDEAAEIMELKALDEVNNLYWYDREVVKLYAKLGSYRAVQEATNIPFSSVYKTVQRACKQIRDTVA